MRSLIDALSPFVPAFALEDAGVRWVEGRPYLFVPELSEVFAVDPSVLRHPDGGGRIADDARALASAGWFVPRRPRPAVRSLTLVVSTTCNLACDYCNISRGTYGREKSFMTPQRAVQAIERLAEKTGPFELFFFGGEPLLAWETIVEATGWTRRHRPDARLFIVTNGTLIDETRASFLAQNEVHVSVSLDGDEATNDRHRKDHAGRGSHARAVDGVDALLRAGVRVLLRGTYTHGGASLATRVEALETIGKRRLPVIVEGLDDRDVGDAYDEETRSSFAGAAKARIVPEPLVGIVAGVLRGAHGNEIGCTAGRDVVVLPDGDLYPCHVAADAGTDRVGSLLDAHEELLRSWRATEERWQRVASKCDGCWARGLCGHGCPMHRVHAGEPSDVACTWSMDRLEYAAYFTDVLDVDALHAVAMKSASANDASAISAGILVRNAFRGAERVLRPLSFPTGAAR